MSALGNMDGAFFVPRTQLLAWVNELLAINVEKIEQCASGAVYCQLVDAIYPGNVQLSKVNWMAKSEYEHIHNYKVLQVAMDKCRIQRHIDVQLLVKGKYQDNFELLQWFKGFAERISPDGLDPYDAVARRATNPKVRAGELPPWASRGPGAPKVVPRPSTAPRTGSVPPKAPAADRPARSRGGYGAQGTTAPPVPSRPSTAAPAAAPPPTSTSSRRGRPDSSPSRTQKLEQEVVDLRITLDALERERDFYFSKLRNIEVTCQHYLDGKPTQFHTVKDFVDHTCGILWRSEEDDEKSVLGAPASEDRTTMAEVSAASEAGSTAQVDPLPKAPETFDLGIDDSW